MLFIIFFYSMEGVGSSLTASRFVIYSSDSNLLLLINGQLAALL